MTAGERRDQRAPGVLARRRRLHPDPDRARGAAHQGPRVRRSVPDDPAAQAPGRGAHRARRGARGAGCRRGGAAAHRAARRGGQDARALARPRGHDAGDLRAVRARRRGVGAPVPAADRRHRLRRGGVGRARGEGSRRRRGGGGGPRGALARPCSSCGTQTRAAVLAVAYPLVARESAVGVLLLAAGARRGGFDLAALSLVEALGSRAATAIDNCLLFQEIQQRDVRKDQFVAMLAHELRNPLGAITSAVGVIEIAGEGTDAAGRALAVIRRQLKSLTELVDDLLDVSRVTSGKITLSRSPLNLADHVERVLEIFRAHGEPRGLRGRRRGAAGVDRRRSHAAGPDHQQPDRQRGEVHAPGRLHPDPRGARGRGRRARGRGQRRRHVRRRARARLRAVLPGRHQPRPSPGRPRRGAHPGAPDRRAARRPRDCGERRRGPRQPLHRAPAAERRVGPRRRRRRGPPRPRRAAAPESS